MADQEKIPRWGISHDVIGVDFDVESLDSENLRAVVEDWPQDIRDHFKETAEIVHHYPRESIESAIEESIRTHPDWKNQGTIDALSLKPETLERLYIAIKEVEQLEQDK